MPFTFGLTYTIYGKVTYRDCSVLVFTSSGVGKVISQKGLSDRAFLLLLVRSEELFIGFGSGSLSLVSIFMPPTLFSEIVSYFCNKVRFFCHSLNSLLRSAKFLSDFLKFAYIKFYSLFCKVL